MPEVNIILHIGVIFLIAYWAKVVSQKLKIPEVTSYVITGVVLGVSVFRFLNYKILNETQELSSVALGIIAFLIGIELKKSAISKLGKAIITIVLLESLGAFLVVSSVFYYLMHFEIYKAILLGSVSAATAPAATVAVIKQYNAKGPLTTTILAVVGIDDAIALTIYVFASAFSKSIMKGANMSFISVILNSFYSIGLSTIIGTLAGFVYLLFFKNTRDEDSLTIAIAGFILAILGICEEIKVSELLSVMVFASIISNFSPTLTKRSERVVRRFTPIFLVIFFIFGGAHLNIKLIKDIGITGLVYFVARSLGKISGASLGATIGKAQSTIKKYIGFSLLPQVGVALALALSIHKEFGTGDFGIEGEKLSTMIINVLLFTTIITEIVGPMLTKFALKKAGEIKD